ncbi:hypothetical protein OC834_002120 [Tilletia horrida]|nr:hypothetical protein OC834_002120 [Tilletia horrida]
MATAFSGRTLLQRSTPTARPAGTRGREAPMDFTYEQQQQEASTSSNASPFLAALQQQAAQRRLQQQQEQQQQQQEEEEDSQMAADVRDDEDDHNRTSRAPTTAVQSLRQYPVGSFGALSLHRKRSQSRRSAAANAHLLGAALPDSRDTTMEDIGSGGSSTARGAASGPSSDYIDIDTEDAGDAAGNSNQLVFPQRSASSSPHHAPALAPPAATINYFLSPFLPHANQQQLQQHHSASSQQQQQQQQQQLSNYTDPASAQQLQSAPRSWIGSNVHHMDWPELLLGHAQFIFNASLLAATLYLLFLIARTVQRDVEWKWLEYRAELETHIASCRTSFERNHCASPTLGVDFQAQCALWARCMQRDPDGVGRARVFAETVADIANGFVDRVSWKTMAFTLLCLFILVGGTNSTLSSYRHAYAARRHAQNSSASSRGRGKGHHKNGGGGGGGNRQGGRRKQQQHQLQQGNQRRLGAIAMQ